MLVSTLRAWHLLWVTSIEIQRGRSGNATGFSPDSFRFPLLIIILPLLLIYLYRLLHWAMNLTRKHIRYILSLSNLSLLLLLLSLFNWNANEFLPGGSDIAIRNNTQKYTYYRK
jgi:hypothetical protein